MYSEKEIEIIRFIEKGSFFTFYNVFQFSPQKNSETQIKRIHFQTRYKSQNLNHKIVRNNSFKCNLSTYAYLTIIIYLFLSM